jgi:hypothetical protein
MVYVRLEGEWIDAAGVAHSPGEMVDVDAGTLAKLQAAGIVGGEKANWAGPTGGTGSATWAGPTSTEP